MVFRDFVTWLLILTVPVIQFSCVSRKNIPPPPPLTKSQLLSLEIKKAEAIEKDPKRAKDQIDEWLRVASMAIDAGHPEYARDVLARTTDLFSSAMTAKDFQKRETSALKLVGGKEEEKYFLGDPYEQMMAYLYLGIFDFQAGDFELARVSFKNASIADGGSAEEGYNSDCYLAFLLEGICSVYLDDMPAAEDAFRFARQAYVLRQMAPLAESAFLRAIMAKKPDVQNKKLLEQLDNAYPVFCAQLGKGFILTDSFTEGMTSVCSAAKQSLEKPEKKSSAEALVEGFSGGNKLQQAKAFLDELTEVACKSVSNEELASINLSLAQFDNLVAACKDKKNNVYILHRLGWGPTRIRLGKYGQMVQFRPYPEPRKHSVITISPASAPNQLVYADTALPAESLDYQARTRGGREMDYILEGRVQFRDTMFFASQVVGQVGQSLMQNAMTYSSQVSAQSSSAVGSMGAVGAGIAVLSLIMEYAAEASHPEGDVRTWEEIPSKLFFACAHLEPGEYKIESRHFDPLGMPLDGTTEKVVFEVLSDRPTLVLTGQIWR